MEPLSVRQLEELIASGAVKQEEIPFRLQNVDDGKPIRLHTSSVYWNEYRKRWVMIGVQDGGKWIYFDGTYVNTFSGNPHPTPSYDYNQLMYRVDLSDPRLKMPEPPQGLSQPRFSRLDF